MTIIQLEYLLAVANYGSFSAAAEKCFVTQPSLSMQVKNLDICQKKQCRLLKDCLITVILHI